MTRDAKAITLQVGVCVVLTWLAYTQIGHGAETREAWTRRALSRLPVHTLDRDEPPKERKERLDGVADAITSVTKSRTEAAQLIAVLVHESGAAAAVQHCQVKGDGGKAVGLWQTHALACPVDVKGQAVEAMRHLRSVKAFCKGTTEEDRFRRGVSLYATGSTCHWAGADKRVATWKAVGSWR